MPDPDVRPPSIDESAGPFGLGGPWPLHLRISVVQHLERLFILLVVAIVGAVFYLFPSKVAFLDLFYLLARWAGGYSG
jgi:hypothetical protein